MINSTHLEQVTLMDFGNASLCDSGSNCTDLSERPYYNDTLLHQLNYERMIFNLPATVILSIIMISGFFGNICVIITYKFFSPKTPANFYILILAIVDFTSCIFGLPYQIFTLCVPYTYPMPNLCRISRFFENFSNLGSGFVLLAVASERYFKINFPLVTYGRTKAKKFTFVVLVLSVSLSWPHFVLNYPNKFEVGKDHVMGEDCQYGNRYDHIITIYVFLFQGFLLFVYVISLSVFGFFYGHILRVIIRRKRQITNNQIMKSTDTNTNPTETRLERCFTVTGVKMRSSKTTLCLVVVTITAMLSYTPFLIIMLLRTSGLYFQTTLLPTGEYFHFGTSAAIDLACTICTKSYFINCALNPIIYSVMNPAFRKRCATGIKRIYVRFSQRQTD